MRTYDLALFAMCLGAAVVLLTPTTLFATGPSTSGSEGITLSKLTAVYLLAITIVGGLVLGGVALFGFSFKQVATISVFGSLWLSAVGTIDLMFFNFMPGPEGSSIVLVIDVLLGIIGIWATFQVASGPATVNE